MSRRRSGWVRSALAALLVAGGMSAVHAVRGALFATDQEVKNRRDVYFLPPPSQVEAMSLGYRYAVADVIWAHVLVTQGFRSKEKRRFENLNRLYDVIYRLDPQWRTPYLMADALLSFQASKMSYEDTLKVREILERGVKERPYDAEIWLNLGQFVSYLAPASYLEPDHPDVAARWRREGVAYLARAAEVGGGDDRFAWQALGGASILKKAGEQGAALRFLASAYERATDPELRQNIQWQLRRMEAASSDAANALKQLRLDAVRAREEAFKAAMREELPFISRTSALLMGPRPAPAACAGGSDDALTCATDWRTWSQRFDARRGPRRASMQEVPLRSVEEGPAEGRPDDATPDDATPADTTNADGPNAGRPR
ncbi:MAG: hypothetical protein AAF715_19255 [Myxococcota bacterium]